ncbi:uncharacterized protein K460DRAFT_404218 [Cucurbitaria berberidis CBS 394.84]|uniref:ubiquitinyl hydrolase 1 n=1 Tax=Cucurbitaria berberidis CBS 394.84 TaxID=1168544 RepID=A0A9P4LBD9_9PLEO|nr:uncharacterized protein K460DRAFT_404218 [Cucurbitaria berberidis CBS 394.84]KAF1848960.1 hypothetical protein K460DRAFT_404218 [Cucurbitaria berberidis CBS 394.84]
MAPPKGMPFLDQLYYHVALPRNVPGQEDRNLRRLEEALLVRFINTTSSLSTHAMPEHQSHIRALQDALVTCKSLNVDGMITRSTLLRELRNFTSRKMLILYASAQNCALLVYEHSIDCGERRVVIEAFETSATCDKVLATKNALLWDFPGCAVSIPYETFSEDSFQESLAAFMEQASTEYIAKFASTTCKAAASLPEIRDTSDPAIVSGLLMTLLEANGNAIQVPILRKRVRDTVSFDKARKPWRRSPFYLVIRVAMQRYLYRLFGADIGRLHYKFTMCLFLSQFLEEVLKRIPFEASFYLRQKLGRRLAKIDSDADQATETTRKTYVHLVRSLEPGFNGIISTTGGYLKSVWRNHKQACERKVPLLRRHAYPTELNLRLTNSAKLLRGVLLHQANDTNIQPYAVSDLLEQYEQSPASVKPYMEITRRHISISQYHEDVIAPKLATANAEGSRFIVEMSKVIKEYVRIIKDSADGYPDQKSQMLLYLFEIWVLMDRAAVKLYPLLEEYRCGFDYDILDPIQLLTLQELNRVQDVQAHLTARNPSRQGFGCKTIFDDPGDSCFAARYYDCSDTSRDLLEMREDIEEHASYRFDAKEVEWEKTTQLYKDLTEQRNETDCLWDPVVLWDGTTESQHRWPCKRHALQDKANNLRIKIYEHPLPGWEPAAKATLFELRCPEDFAAYRDATWFILSTLCHPPTACLDQVSLIREYSQLRPYANDTTCNVVLGSEQKAHVKTHYSGWEFPIDLSTVRRVCGLKPKYYDTSTQTWTGNRKKASLWHHFPLMLPNDSPLQVLNLSFQDWPTSNLVQASQADCPTDQNVHEFMAWQGLLVGTHSRWLDLLREMGSTSLNFSAETTWTLVHRLALQVGPTTSSDDPRRDVHSAILDYAICSKLLQQVQQRLEAINRNWREPIQMDILITILSKIASLSATSTVRSEAKGLLQKARRITNTWRAELQSIITEDSKVTQFAVWASLLCKRTFHLNQDLLLDPEALRHFIDASISLHYNLTGVFSSMPYNLRNAIILDVLFAYENRGFIKNAIIAESVALVGAVDNLWHIPQDQKAVNPIPQPIPDTSWFLLTVGSETMRHSYSVHYNYLYGTLLIDGKEMGALPLAYRSHSSYGKMFGNKIPIVFPSPLHGMSFALLEPMKNDHRIHLGFRNNVTGGKDMVIRAVQKGQLLEFIPPCIFGNQSPDLPAPLLEGCFHWLNVHTGQLEIRRQDIWASKPGNWSIVGIHTGLHQAIRFYGEPREARLLDPSSALAREITRIFEAFEHPDYITVFASRDLGVAVELKRLELSFFVNDVGLLYSKQLSAVILQNQDAGTWYGLRSKIVIQSIANRRQKSILIPLGDIRSSREGHHVSVELEMGSGVYLKFGIDEVLGRIHCPPEPRLIYMKALLHAYTSHVMYDPLTKRTGSEETIHLLQTGSYFPWSPLSDENVKTLKQIADLSPLRGYYPKDGRCMETVTWQPALPVSIQDDRYRALIEMILSRSSDLSSFFLGRLPHIPMELSPGNPHLEVRAMSRSHAHKFKQDIVYHARDNRKTTLDRINVIEISKLLLRWQPHCSDGPTLLSLLHDAPVVGGYDKFFQKCLLSEHLVVDVRADWGALVQRFLDCTAKDRYKLMFLLGPMVFSIDANLDLIRILVSFAMIPEIRALHPPQHPAYHHFRADGVPKADYLVSLMAKAKMPFSELGFKKRHQMVVAKGHHSEWVDKSCELLAYSIQKQWPSPEIDLQELVYIDSAHLNVERALADLSPEWIRLTRNHELAIHLEKVQTVLDRVTANEATVPGLGLPVLRGEEEILSHRATLYPTRVRDRDNPTLSRLLHNTLDLFSAPGLTFLPHITTNSNVSTLAMRSGNVPGDRLGLQRCDGWNKKIPRDGPNRVPNVQRPRFKHHIHEISLLRNIVASFEGTSSFVQSRYAKELKLSINALQGYLSRRPEDTRASDSRVTSLEIMPAKHKAMGVAEYIRGTLQAQSPQAKWLQMVDLWPRMTTVDLLTELRSTSGTVFGEGARKALVTFGLAISKWQHLLRIQDAQKRRKEQQERDELANQGHTNWSPLIYSDWLLLEIDGDILLREEQVQVALATISPESGENSVLQLLMGKGKTSCILPMVAAVLANQLDLARIVVPRPLLLQSAQVMQAKLGGLVNRQIIHVPFSRKTPTTQALMRLYRKLHSQAKDNSGIILALPEHILSFKLSGMQQLCDNHVTEASTMIRTQKWLDKHVRDVLDECDVSFAIRTQLIYPSGNQMTVDGHPLRWQITQMLLHHVKDFLPTVQARYRRSIEIVERGVEGFPLIYFLRKDAEDFLIELLLRLICNGQAQSILPCAELPEAARQDVKAYISLPMVRTEVTSRVIEYLRDQKLMKIVTLLRGLFVHRILISCLKKRWNVQYGLHPRRAPIAVPYLAKGVPSPTAEWGHPDVAIVLTCLSFYYQGLTIGQFKQAFEQLVRSDEPSVEYEKWIMNSSIPNGLDDFATINVDDNWQLMEVHRSIRSNADLINFYLNNFVFPKYAKTFSLKLQASGWNLFPSLSVHAKGCRVTGFSGTNDSRHQLPMLIKQADLPHLEHTNAEVPFYLLAPRNQGYVRMTHVTGARWTEIDLLDHLTNRVKRPQQELRYTEKIRILIDAGAQILEHSNRHFASAWLERDTTEAAAAVYFGDDHRAWVIYPNSNKRMPLLASPFADSLDRCLVYLDESHCRGTDLKLPTDARAALTLGPHLTKDALVQAAMRLRLLGQSQSVIFYSPPEVHQGILDRLQKDEFFLPDSAAVLQWVIGQTCDTIEQQDPSYFAQTSHYLKQEQAQLEYPEYLEDEQSRVGFLAAVRIKESMSLKQLYEPKTQRHTANAIAWNQHLQPFANALQLRKKHFQDRGSAVHASVLEEVEIEQEREAEREVENEVEDVRETQRPPRFSACKISTLHEDVKHFATEGRLVAGSDAYNPMFSVLGRTALGTKHAISVNMNSNLWVSKQFTRTVDTYESNDNYIRSCHWVLWSFISQKALIISPEEANELIPILRPSTSYNAGVDIGVHLVLYSTPVTRRMLHFNRLDYYAIPSLPTDFKAPVWLSVELGIFSGRLHFEWDEYHELLSYLGLCQDPSPDLQKQAFAPKPLTFLHEWIALRRKGQDFEHTPMGFVTTGKPLTANHPFFRALAHDACDPDIRPQVARITSGHGDDGEIEEDDGDHDDDEFVPAVEHIDDSDVEDERLESEDDGEYVDAAEAPEDAD